MLDFTNCKRLYDRVYNGANGKKIAIEYEGEPYMLKFPPSGENKPTELSYTNSCISEHIASTVFNMVGIPRKRSLEPLRLEEKVKLSAPARISPQTEVDCSISALSRIPS